MRTYTQSQSEAINNVERLLLKKAAQDKAIKAVEDLLQKRIGVMR